MDHRWLKITAPKPAELTSSCQIRCGDERFADRLARVAARQVRGRPGGRNTDRYRPVQRSAPGRVQWCWTVDVRRHRRHRHRRHRGDTGRTCRPITLTSPSGPERHAPPLARAEPSRSFRRSVATFDPCVILTRSRAARARGIVVAATRAPDLGTCGRSARSREGSARHHEAAGVQLARTPVPRLGPQLASRRFI